MAIAILLGGSGATSPLSNLLIELIGLALLVAALWRPRVSRFTRTERGAIVLLLLILATPLAQLVPLPPSLWAELPGRETAALIQKAIGSNAWQPLSIDREATWLAAAYLIPAAAIFLATLKLQPTDQRLLAGLAVAGALLSLLLGALQFASGPETLRLYESTHSAYATGLFINRNHQADMMLIGMILASALLWSRSAAGGSLALWFALVVAFTAGVLATSSRTGFLLLPLAILASASFIPFAWLRRRRLLAGVGVAAAIAVGLLIAASNAVSNVVSRFGQLADARFDYWPDVLFVAREYLPWGSGVGTFALAFGIREDLNRVVAPYLNHAHNDYLQILVEAGLWGVLLTFLFLALYLWLSFSSRGFRDPLRRAASFAILILLIHSAVDYPLRMLSLLTLFAFLCGLLVARQKNFADGSRNCFESNQKAFYHSSFHRVEGDGARDRRLAERRAKA